MGKLAETILCMTVLALSCSKEEPVLRPIEPDRLTFGWQGGTATVDFNKNMRWAPVCDSAWCSVRAYAWQPKECSRLIFECDANPLFSKRGCTAYIILGDVTDSITVVQEGRPYAVRFTGSDLTMQMGEERGMGLVFEPEEASVLRTVWTSSDSTVLKIDDAGNVQALMTGYADVIALTEGGLADTCRVRVTERLPKEIDLGLSVLWADRNVGADSSDAYGDYYSWGDKITYYEYGQARVTTPQWKEGKAAGYDWKSYKFRDYRHGEKLYDVKLTKYNSDLAFGAVDNRSELLPTDDVATEKYGDGWRMPTYREFKELLDSCDSEWTTDGGMKGIRLTSRVKGFEGASIFLPASGCRRYRDYAPNVDVDGGYWTSTLGSGRGQDSPFMAWHAAFREDSPVHLDMNYRCDGRTVRAVHSRN